MKGGIFSEPDYVRLWIAGTISSAIRWLDALAFSVVAYQQTGSAFLVAMLMMLRLLPMGLFGAIFGALAERVQRRTILLAITAAMGLTSAALTALAWSGQLATWHLAVAAFVNGIGWLSDSTVRRLLLGEVVGADRVSAAVSFDSASSNLSRMLGPTAGGLLLAGIGVAGAFGIGAVLYIAAFAAISGMRYRNTIPPSGGPSILARIMGGIGLVRRDRRLVGVLVLTSIFNLFGWPATSMVPVLAQGRLALGTEATGLLVSMDGLGALAASLLIATLARTGAHGRIYVAGTLLYFIAEIGLAIAPEPWSAGFMVMLSGVAAASFGIMQTTLIYLTAPAEMRSRVFGVLSACIGIGPIGFLHLGLLAEAVGPPWATALSGAEGVVALIATRRWWIPLIRPLRPAADDCRDGG